MATVASGVSLSFGLLTCTVSMTSAVEAKVSNTNVCTGVHSEHAITKINSVSRCSVCGDIGYADIKKARQVGDGYVLLTDEDLATVAGTEEDQRKAKKTAALTAHPGADVDMLTTSGEKLYYLTPAPGSEPAYATLFALVNAHPELVFLAQWTPRTKSATFALRAFAGVLCFQERERAESLRQAPEVPTDAPENLVAMAEQVLALPGLVVPFDPATYADTYEQKVAAILAERTPTALVVPTVPEGAPVTTGNAMDALAAMLAQATTPVVAKPARKSRAKKVSA